MEYDAFDAGIELGGLRNRDDIRLLICYLLKSVESPMTRQMLNDAMQEDGLANYFEVSQAIEELLKTGNIVFDVAGEDEVFSVTQKGKEAAEMLQTSLPMLDWITKESPFLKKILPNQNDPCDKWAPNNRSRR